jgi:YidC/Oxa1 family membrane protein insertase
MYEKLPNLKMFGGAIDLGATPNITQFNWLLLVPILTFVSYFLSMKLTRKLTYQPMADDKAMGCSNKVMDIMMPLFSVYIAFMVPAAIGVYWIFKSLLGVVKQAVIKVAMPLPKFTDEDYKAAEKEIMGKAEKAPQTNKSGRVVRSLHHIDDEDFADTAEAAKKHREALEAQAAEDAAKKEEAAKNSKLLGGAGMKQDDRAEENRKKKAKKSEKEDQDNNKTDGE